MERNILGYLWHFAYSIETGAVRIGVSTYTDALGVTAFEKKEKNTVVILNRTKKTLSAVLRLKDQTVKVGIAAESIGTYVIEA